MAADNSLQGMVNTWANSPVTLGTGDNASTGTEGSLLQPGVTGFLSNNPIISSNEFQDLTDNQPVSALQDMLSPQTPSYISTILSNYQNAGQQGLKNMAAPTNNAVSTAGYQNAAANAGQVNAQGQVNTPAAVTSFNNSQNAQYATEYANYQQSQTSIENALQTLTNPATAQSATLSFTTNAINQVLNQYNWAGVDPASLQSVVHGVQSNLSNFTEYNQQMQQLFESNLNLSYNLPGDITNAMWANNVTPGIIQSQTAANNAANAPAAVPTNTMGPGGNQ